MRPLGQKATVEEETEEKETDALNGSSAPSPDEKKSWANEIIDKAQLVATRVLRRETDRFVKLSKSDQAPCSCVGRRVTKDLETGEVLADENLTWNERRRTSPATRPTKETAGRVLLAGKWLLGRSIGRRTQ